MATQDVIVVGASAGGVEALSTLVSALPADLPAAVFIVLHLSAEWPSFLPRILGREAKLPVRHAINGEPITRGRVYVAPPDLHLLIEGEHVKLVHGPKENLHRPSVDTLFRSAARWVGPRVIGVVLTGARNDGTAGMRAIKQRGGIAIVQDPVEATFPSMALWSAVRALEEQMILAKRIVERSRKANRLHAASVFENGRWKPKGTVPFYASWC